MATWFVRLGADDGSGSRALNEDFAETHSLVKIGYGIEEDITKESRNGIKQYLYDIGKRDASLGHVAGLVDTFINHIQIGDVIICPFGRNPEEVRIGIVKSECKAVESFFKPSLKFFFKSRQKKLQKIIDEHRDSDEIGFIKIKPARKVKWITKNMDKNAFSNQLKSKLKKFMPRTVSRLDLKDEEIAELSSLNDTKDYNKEIIENIRSILSKAIKDNGNRLLKNIEVEKLFARAKETSANFYNALIFLSPIFALLSLILTIWSLR